MSRKNKESLKVGRTIATEWERQESESERLAARKKQKTRKIFRLLFSVLITAIIVIIIVMEVIAFIDRREKVEAAKNVPQPTIDVIDENGLGVTSKMKEFVAILERDLADLGYGANRAVVPAGKTREIHLFLNGYDFYVKYNIDRGTGVSAEDTDRMLKYLEEKDIHPSYVDVRIEGKGYYK